MAQLTPATPKNEPKKTQDAKTEAKAPRAAPPQQQAPVFTDWAAI